MNFMKMRATKKKISKEHVEILNDLFPRPEVFNEIVRRVWNGTTYGCRHGRRVFFKVGCARCDAANHDLGTMRQGIALADACMYRWMIRAAELGDKNAQRWYRMHVKLGRIKGPVPRQKRKAKKRSGDQ